MIGYDQTQSLEPKYTNTSTVLGFKLTEDIKYTVRCYNETMPIFQIVLDFILDSGGII